MAKLILDGRTRKGSYGPTYGWDKITFEYRPALHKEVVILRKRMNEDPVGAADASYVFLKERLTRWNVEGGDGTEAPITVENIAAIPFPILEDLISQVMGYGQAQEAADAKN